MNKQLEATDVVQRAEVLMMGISNGPWRMGNRAHPDCVITKRGNCMWHPERGEINNINDGIFIAGCRDLVPDLVAEVKRLYAENRSLVEQLAAQ